MHKLFGKWDFIDVEIKDPSIRNYINIMPVTIPHSGGRNSKKQFGKSNVNIVERLINKVIREENNTGQKITATKMVQEAFDIINMRTGHNPIQILVNAISNAGPREEIVRLQYGGIAIQKSVDTAPQRRVDTALRLIAQGVQQAAFDTKKRYAHLLAEEIIAVANYDVKCFVVDKKDNIERIAKASR